MQRLLGAVCHKDVRAVKDSAIVLRADRVETLDAEPTALGPEKGIEKNKARVSVLDVVNKKQQQQKNHTDFLAPHFFNLPSLQHALKITI